MSVTKVLMPKLSEAMEEGKIIKWLKKEGDRIAGGDILAEVETDKANVEMEAFGSGVLRKILVPEGGSVAVGALIGVIADPSEDISGVVSAGAPAAKSGSAPPPPADAAPEPDAPSSAPAGRATTSAPSTTEPPPADAGTTKPATGTADRPASVPPVAKAEDPAARAPAGQRPDETAAPSVAQAPPDRGAAAPTDGRLRVSPLARKIATQAGVDLKAVQGSGPGGRIVRRDVEPLVTAGPRGGGDAAGQAPPTPAGAGVAGAMVARPSVGTARADTPEFEDLALTSMRAAIAKRMPQSKAPVPHFYVTTEISMDRASELRAELNAMEGMPKVSVNDMVVRACAIALLDHPGVNASFTGDAIRIHHRAHIGIAVALEDGLITPVLRDCDRKSLAQIAADSRDLAERARHRKLRAQEISGATFSISNLGMFDVAEFSAIINPPEGAILAVGSVRSVPVVTGEQVGVGRRMNVTISCDHRVMDGAMAARFLQDVKRLLEEPLRLLV